eukprot:2251471-Rhodomonas_salina.6
MQRRLVCAARTRALKLCSSTAMPHLVLTCVVLSATGLMDDAFDYLQKKSHGDDTEEAYPYTGKQGQCHFQVKTATLLRVVS